VTLISVLVNDAANGSPPLFVEGFTDLPNQALNLNRNQLAAQFLPGRTTTEAGRGNAGGIFIEEEEEEEGVAGGLTRKLQQVIGRTAAGGQVTITGNAQRVRYIPPARNPAFIGRDIAIYTACNQNGLCNSAFIFIVVQQDSPTISPTLAPNFP